MGLYKVPFDFTHEEKKYFGGYLSLRQMLYVIASVISLGILFSYFNNSKNNNIFKCSSNTYDFCF